MQDAWNEVRALLPAWVACFGLAPALAAGPWAWLSTRLIAALALRRHQRQGPDAHWSQRALAAYPVRVAARLTFIAFCVATGLLPWLVVGPLARPSAGVLACVGMASAALGALAAAHGLERRLRPGLSGSELLRDAITAPLVRYPHLVIAAFAAVYLPQAPELADLPAFLVVALLLTAAAYGAGLHVARALGLARPGGPRLRAAVAHVADPPAVYSLPLAQANAFAFPVLRCIAFTPTIERLLGDDELREVAAHELEHLNEPRWFRLLRGAIGVWMLAPLCACRALLSAFGWWAIAACLLNALGVALGFRVLSRRMEARADHGTHDSRTYALALERVYEANLVPAVLPGRGASHPHLYDRLLALGVKPSYPRPAAPRARGALLAVLGSVYLYMLAPYLLAMQQDAVPSEAQLYLRVAVHGGEAWGLGELGRRRWTSGQLAAATAFYRGALLLAPGDLRYVTGFFWTLARQGRCDELERARQAQRAATGSEAVRRSLEAITRHIACENVAQAHPMPSTSRTPGAR